MAIRNDKLGGTDYINGETLYDYDLDDTNNAILDFVGPGLAESSYRILQSNNIFTNGEQYVVDEFIDEGGSKNTVDTINTTCFYDESNTEYISLIQGDGVQDTENYESTMNTGGSVNGYYGAVTQVNLNCVLKTVTKHPNANTSVCRLLDISGTVITTTTNLVGDIFTFSDNPILKAGDSYIIDMGDPSTYAYRANVSASYPYNNTHLNFTQASTNGNPSGTTTAWNFVSVQVETGEFVDSVITCDTNTKLLDGNESSLCVFADKTLTSNTSITVDITDGSTTISDQPLNTVIGIAGLGSGTLGILFNLNTTDTSETATMKGYGVYIK